MRLIIDGNNLAAVQFHGMPLLQYGSVHTGAIYGFLRETIRLMEEYSPDIVFAFDSGESKRKSILPNYKYRRDFVQSTDGRDKKIRREQTIRLRDHILPDIGFSNVWHVEGYEADDIIAKAVNYYACDWLIVSGDKDLWQCLAPGVDVYDISKKEVITKPKFINKFGVSPSEWAYVKAIAGDDTDDIPGVQGIGIGKACQFVRNEIKPHTLTHGKILHAMELIKRNHGLTRLPLPGTPSFKLNKDKTTPEKWRKVFNQYGIRNLKVPNG